MIAAEDSMPTVSLEKMQHDLLVIRMWQSWTGAILGTSKINRI